MSILPLIKRALKIEKQVKFGDVWKIGEHLLLCGDSTKECMTNELLKEHKISLCVTDPPYGVNYKSTAKEESSLFKLKVANDHISSWGEAFRLSKAPVLYCWFSFKHYDVVSRALVESGYRLNQVVVWFKNHFSLQRYLYHNQHENCIVAHKNDVKISTHWRADRKQRSVWQVGRVAQKERIHATEKPLGVYLPPILNHTDEGDCIVDMFAGSGVIFEAAEKTKRKALGIEICPHSCHLILQRMEKLGLKVEKERNIFALL